MKLGTIAAGVGIATSIQLQYVPQFLYFTSPTVPQSIRMDVAGDGTPLNITAKAITGYKNLRQFANPANVYLIQLANGQILNKVVTLTFVNGDAAAFDVYGFGRGNGSVYLRYQPLPVLANSGTTINKFAALLMPDLAAGDTVNIEYQNGFVQKMDLPELRYVNALWQNDVDAGVVMVYNLDQSVKNVNVIAAAAQTFFILDYQPVGNLTQLQKV